MSEPYYVKPGEIVRLELPFSEVCVHMRVAGTVMSVRFEESGAQLLREDGGEFSVPITTGEAGFYFDSVAGKHYCYPALTEDIRRLMLGPFCECDDFHCHEPLGITWKEWDGKKGEVLIAPTCPHRKEIGK